MTKIAEAHRKIIDLMAAHGADQWWKTRDIASWLFGKEPQAVDKDELTKTHRSLAAMASTGLVESRRTA
jgi:hypothetical protein